MGLATGNVGQLTKGAASGWVVQMCRRRAIHVLGIMDTARQKHQDAIAQPSAGMRHVPRDEFGQGETRGHERMYRTQMHAADRPGTSGRLRGQPQADKEHGYIVLADERMKATLQDPAQKNKRKRVACVVITVPDRAGTVCKLDMYGEQETGISSTVLDRGTRYLEENTGMHVVAMDANVHVTAEEWNAHNKSVIDESADERPEGKQNQRAWARKTYERWRKRRHERPEAMSAAKKAARSNLLAWAKQHKLIEISSSTPTYYQMGGSGSSKIDYNPLQMASVPPPLSGPPPPPPDYPRTTLGLP